MGLPHERGRLPQQQGPLPRRRRPILRPRQPRRPQAPRVGRRMPWRTGSSEACSCVHQLNWFCDSALKRHSLTGKTYMQSDQNRGMRRRNPEVLRGWSASRPVVWGEGMRAQQSAASCAEGVRCGCAQQRFRFPSEAAHQRLDHRIQLGRHMPRLAPNKPPHAIRACATP